MSVSPISTFLESVHPLIFEIRISAVNASDLSIAKSDTASSEASPTCEVLLAKQELSI